MDTECILLKGFKDTELFNNTGYYGKGRKRPKQVKQQVQASLLAAESIITPKGDGFLCECLCEDENKGTEVQSSNI